MPLPPDEFDGDEVQPAALPITQADLAAVARLEDELLQARANLYERLKRGARVEPGPLQPDEQSFKTPLRRIVRRPSETTELPARPRPALAEPSFDGGLTFSEQRMLRHFATTGDFHPQQVRAIVDRFALLARRLFQDDLERMAAFGSFSMAAWLNKRARFEYHLMRVRFLIWIREYGVTRASAPILRGIYGLNRQYFAVQQR